MIAVRLGFDLSTTGLAVGVIGTNGEEDFASVPMVGATEWLGQPAFDLDYLPKMIAGVLRQLIEKGWSFSEPGALSFSVRQHDMVVLDKHGKFVIPALSWQCNAAVKETKLVNEMTFNDQLIGKVEERFILPKLMWAICEGLHSQTDQIDKVMTTGDYIAYRLTGIARLSTSDARSNGLLLRKSKNIKTNCLADNVILACGLESEWFPPVIESGTEIGLVRIEELAWHRICSILKDWKVISCLGDNHAGAVGCGLNSDDTIVVSAGTSGTVVRIGHIGEQRLGQASRFEYYDEELLLMMMARCGDWYEDFKKRFGQDKSFKQIDKEVEALAGGGENFPLYRVTQKKEGDKLAEVYPNKWFKFPLAGQAASVQASIALELLLLVKKMLVEVVDSSMVIHKVVLTGNQSQSAFFREVIARGLEILQPGLKLFLSDRKGPLAYKAAALGAMINAIGRNSGENILDVIGKQCPTSEVPRQSYAAEDISVFLRKYLS